MKPLGYLITHPRGTTPLFSEHELTPADIEAGFTQTPVYKDVPLGLAVYHLQQCLDVLAEYYPRSATAKHARAYLDGLKHVTHHKRGGDYIVLGTGKIQTDSWVKSPAPGVFTSLESVDNEELVAYLADDGSLWFRPPGEFNDGRFKEKSK